jgi:hypothetical protein
MAIPVAGRAVLWGCEKSRLTYFLDNQLTDNGEVQPYAPAVLATPGPQCGWQDYVK